MAILASQIPTSPYREPLNAFRRVDKRIAGKLNVLRFYHQPYRPKAQSQIQYEFRHSQLWLLRDNSSMTL